MAQETIDAGASADAADPTGVVESTDPVASGGDAAGMDPAAVATDEGGRVEAEARDLAGAATASAPERQPHRGSYAASRFGLGFAAGLLVAGAVGVATNSLALAVIFGFSVGLLLGVAAMEYGDGAAA